MELTKIDVAGYTLHECYPAGDAHLWVCTGCDSFYTAPAQESAFCPLCSNANVIDMGPVDRSIFEEAEDMSMSLLYVHLTDPNCA